MPKKIILIFLLSIFLLLFLSGFCLALEKRKLETVYPTLPEVKTPTTVKTALPDYLRYVFTFAIIISGLVAFGAMIYGGILYLTSTGDPTKISEGKNQAIAGILGLIIVLSSFLILNTINPQLVLPTSPPLEAIAGIYAYVKTGCVDMPDDSYDDRVLLSQAEIPDLSARLPADKDGSPQSLQCIEFLSPKEELTVWVFAGKDFSSPKTKYEGDPGEKVDVTGESIKLDYHPAGVYLYSNSVDCGKTSTTGDLRDVEMKIYQSSSATLPEFDNETMSIKFIYGDKDSDKDEYGVQFAAILHEDENFMGQAMLFDQGQGEDNCQDLSVNSYGGPADIGVSSITIYLKPIGAPIGEGVRFWGDKSYTMEKDKFILPEQNPETEKKYYGKNHSEWNEGYYAPDVEEEMEGSNDKITSMEIDGHYIALLFEDEDFKNDCEVFTESKPDFRPFRIGQCGFLGRSDCLSSFIIKPRK